MGYWHTHRPLPWDPTGTGWCQADIDLTDGVPRGPWPLPVSWDVLTGRTWSNLPAHTHVLWRWTEQHHMDTGIVMQRLYGIKTSGLRVLLHTVSGPQTAPTQKDRGGAPEQVSRTIDLAGAVYACYEVEIDVEIRSVQDAFMAGNIYLGAG